MTTLPKAHLAVASTSDGLAYTTTIVVNEMRFRVLVDTTSSVGLMLSCTSVAAAQGLTGSNQTACLQVKHTYESCPADSTKTSIAGDPTCQRYFWPSMDIQLGEVTIPRYSTKIITADTSRIFHGADGMLGIAPTDLSGRTRSANLTDQIQSFSTYYATKDPYLLINEAISLGGGWTALRQLAMSSNASAVAIRGFSESADKTFVTTKHTQAALNGSEYVRGWIDAAWPSIIFPTNVFNAFHTKYLTGCTPHNESSEYVKPKYYYCDPKITLPRLAFTTTNGTYYLDQEDYMQTNASEPSKAIVLVQNTTSYKYLSEEWGLGMPFVRKFPALFDASGSRHRITLYCRPGETCDTDTKWVVVGARAVSEYDLYYETGIATKAPVKATTHSSSETHYWVIPCGLPVAFGVFVWRRRSVRRGN